MPDIDAIFLAGLAACLCLTIFKLDLWPLTRYTMFSRYAEPEQIRAIRFALRKTDGQRVWWEPRCYRYQHRIGEQLLDAPPARVLWGVSEVLRLIRIDGGDLGQYSAVEVVERRWNEGEIHERTVAAVPMGTFRAV
ncbi:MAG TPA: hypothetical protein VHB50_20725 [Bryobacteraceae bacterium]|nr:hypothetical protein [Bryobacteraceae bacterium]